MSRSLVGVGWWLGHKKRRLVVLTFRLFCNGGGGGGVPWGLRGSLRCRSLVVVGCWL